MTTAHALAGASVSPAPVALVRAEPGVEAVDRWLHDHQEHLQDLLTAQGAVVVRGLDAGDPARLRAAADALTNGPIPEREAFVVRAELAPGVYPATPWPADSSLCLHHELAHSALPPTRLFFACSAEPVEGGCTTLADAHAVLEFIPDRLREDLTELGWQVVRVYDPALGSAWATAFGDMSRDHVDRWCAKRDIETEWLADDVLRTVQTRPAVVVHPETGRPTWFNSVSFLSRWTLDPDVRDCLESLSPHGLPFDTRRGDGAPLAAEEVAAVHEAYARVTRRVQWRIGDLLLLDNLRTAHGRDAYTGGRRLLTALASPRPVQTWQPPGAQA